MDQTWNRHNQTLSTTPETDGLAEVAEHHAAAGRLTLVELDEITMDQSLREGQVDEDASEDTYDNDSQLNHTESAAVPGASWSIAARVSAAAGGEDGNINAEVLQAVRSASEQVLTAKRCGSDLRKSREAMHAASMRLGRMTGHQDVSAAESHARQVIEWARSRTLGSILKAVALSDPDRLLLVPPNLPLSSSTADALQEEVKTVQKLEEERARLRAELQRRQIKQGPRSPGAEETATAAACRERRIQAVLKCQQLEQELRGLQKQLSKERVRLQPAKSASVSHAGVQCGRRWASAPLAQVMKVPYSRNGTYGSERPTTPGRLSARPGTPQKHRGR
eukprot:Hpha_TRINITY_DN33487_c0_g1::TRINITY_DN33487_c0_g1_i1::g.786::m.786